MALRHSMTLVLAVVALATAARVEAGDPDASGAIAAGRPVSLHGEIVDLECFLRDGARGRRHRACALACRDRGASLALVEDGSGALYPIAGRTPASDPGEAVAHLIAERVSIEGRLYERAGARILVVEEAVPLP